MTKYSFKHIDHISRRARKDVNDIPVTLCQTKRQMETKVYICLAINFTGRLVLPPARIGSSGKGKLHLVPARGVLV